MLMVGCGAPRRPNAVLTTGLSPPRAGSGDALARVEDHPELADLDLVTVDQHGFVDPAAPHVGAVQAAYVADDELPLAPDELDVLARDRDVVQEDVAAWVAPRGGALAVQQEACSRVRAALNDQESRPGGQGIDRRLVGGAHSAL